MVILGDAGINYYCDLRDGELKSELSLLPITLLCIHGNHEERPFELGYDEIKEYVESQLEKCDWCVDYVFSHTVPIQYEPVWAFIPGLNQNLVDKSMERWLQDIAEKLDYERWFAGHYHVESQEGSVRIMFEDYEELE